MQHERERDRSMSIHAYAATTEEQEEELVTAGSCVTASQINEPVLDIVPVQSVWEYWEK